MTIVRPFNREVPVIQLPESSYADIAAHSCSNCNAKFSASHTRAAGVKMLNEGTCALFYDLLCPRCGLLTHCTTKTVLNPLDWVKEIAFGCGFVVLNGKRPNPDRFLTIRHPDLGLALLLRPRTFNGPPSTRKITSVGLFGGYRDFEDTHNYLLFRWIRDRQPFDGLFRIEPPNRVRLVGPKVQTGLQPYQWEDFIRAPDGTHTKVNGRLMVKLCKDRIEHLVRDRMYHLSNLLTDADE